MTARTMLAVRVADDHGMVLLPERSRCRTRRQRQQRDAQQRERESAQAPAA